MKKTSVAVSGRFMQVAFYSRVGNEEQLTGVSSRQKEVADAMGIEIKTLSIGEKLKMRKEWVDRHPGVKMVQVDQVITNNKKSKYTSIISEVNLCEYAGLSGVIITEINNRVRIVLEDGRSAVITSRCKKADFEYRKDKNRIRFNIDGVSLFGERVVGIAYGWMLDALPENLDNYEVNVMDFSGSLKPHYNINSFNFSPDNLEFVTGGKGGRNNLHKSMWMSMWREDTVSGKTPQQYKFSAYDIKVV